MPSYQVTVRYGSRRQRYHTYRVDAPDVVGALREAAEDVPEAIADEADLVEIRPVPDPDEREYVGEAG